jgi:putative hydrolase of the HAD superfamily
VVFDYGEVISREPTETDRASLVARAGVDADAFWPAYWAHREALDQGTASIGEYWARVLHDLGAGGTRIALLSNAGADFTGWLRYGSFSPLFERVFVSGELGLVKPHAEIYEHVIGELGITPDAFVFIDNKSENVEGAKAVGGDGHVFTDAASLESWLRDLAA